MIHTRGNFSANYFYAVTKYSCDETGITLILWIVTNTFITGDIVKYSKRCLIDDKEKLRTNGVEEDRIYP